MYIVTFGRIIKPYVGFFKPYNAVRDEQAYSLNYLPTSVINGFEKELEIPLGSIIRHKLTFDTQNKIEEQVKTLILSPKKLLSRDYQCNGYYASTVFVKHYLTNPEITLAFDKYEHAELALHSTLYAGQFEHLIFPISGITEMTQHEFDSLGGVETFPSSADDDEAIFSGFNRFRDNERMFLKVKRTKWSSPSLI